MAESEFTAQVEYRNIPNHPGYRVGSDGSVWSCWRRAAVSCLDGDRMALSDEWKPLRGSRVCGRVMVKFRDGKLRSVHRLVLEVFVGPCPEGMECCHNDGVPTNNSLANLRWDTRKENHADSLRHGTKPLGERHSNAKLTDEQVKAMRLEYAAGGITQPQLAAKYHVSQAVVSDILLRKRWKHI